jgi:DNA-binding IclR family transcriptional regulator
MDVSIDRGIGKCYYSYSRNKFTYMNDSPDNIMKAPIGKARSIKTESEAHSSGNIVKSAARVLDLLEIITAAPEGLTLTDLHNATQLPASSLHGLLSTLVSKDFARKDTLSLRYHLGPKILHLAGNYQERGDLISFADPVMIRLGQITSETTSLSLLLNDTTLFIHKRHVENIVQVINPTGTTLPAHATGAGKVMLAYLDRSTIDASYPSEKLPDLTPYTITSKTELLAALSDARKLGYAYDEEESAIGVWAVASCIFGSGGEPIASLSIVGPKSRVQTKDPSEWHKLVSGGAADISAAFGYVPAH